MPACSIPQALLTGKATLGDGKGERTVRGTAWIEHQWGNFRGPSNFHSRYQWAWARMDNGDLMTYTQWHSNDAADKGELLQGRRRVLWCRRWALDFTGCWAWLQTLMTCAVLLLLSSPPSCCPPFHVDHLQRTGLLTSRRTGNKLTPHRTVKSCCGLRLCVLLLLAFEYATASWLVGWLYVGRMT